MPRFIGTITCPSYGIYHATTQHSHFEMASDRSAPNPVDTLLASLCGCLAHHVGDYYREEKMAHLNFTIGAEADLTDAPARLGDIKVTITFEGEGLAPGRHAALLSSVTQCCIYQSLLRNSRIHLQIAR